MRGPYDASANAILRTLYLMCDSEAEFRTKITAFLLAQNGHPHVGGGRESDDEGRVQTGRTATLPLRPESGVAAKAAAILCPEGHENDPFIAMTGKCWFCGAALAVEAAR